MTQYQTLDQLIVDAIRNGSGTFATIYTKRVYTECERIAKQTARDRFRVLDGRLQTLRRRGEIAFNKGSWTAAPTPSKEAA